MRGSALPVLGALRCHTAPVLDRALSALRDAERAHRALQLRHLVERVAEQPLGHAKVAQLHAAARPTSAAWSAT